MENQAKRINFTTEYKTKAALYIAGKVQARVVSDLERQVMHESNLYHMFKDEIQNNLLNNTKEENLEYLNYLIDLFKGDLKGFDFDSTIANNLKVYYLHQNKLEERYDLQEWQEILDSFSHLIGSQGIQLTEQIREDYFNQNYKSRQWGLPFICYSGKDLFSILSQLCEQGLQDEFFDWVMKIENPDEISNPQIKNAVAAFIYISSEISLSKFLWLIAGYVLTMVDEQEAKQKKLIDVFRNKDDVQNIKKILISKEIINEHDCWLGIIF